MEESQSLLEHDIKSNPFNSVNNRNTKMEESHSKKTIPSWGEINNHYEQRWLEEKEKFQNQLKGNFFDLVGRFASGKQEIFQLCAPDRRVKLYTRAFLEMFESDYAPHVGEVERLAGKKVRRLFVTLPHNYHD
tara:strand:+ start:10144 stop:10542 length:399 start_codon:yes stop_codon:yes gene_type:complete